MQTANFFSSNCLPISLATRESGVVKYNIKVLFCGSPYNAEKMAVSLMRRVIENHKNE